MTEPKAWAWFLREVRGGLVDWWQVWDDGARALDELPRFLVDDRTKPAKDRWSSQLRRLWRELHRWVQETRVSFNNQAYEVNLAAFVRAVREGEIPAGWRSKVASLGTFLRDLDAVQDNLGNCPYVKKPKPAQVKATSNDAAPAQAVGLGVTIQPTTVGAAEPKEPRRPVCESKAVKLFGPGEQPEVNGKRKPTLTKARYDAIKALIEAGEDGLTKDGLVKNSGHGDAVNSLKRLAKKDRDWKRVLQFAGETGKRHRIR